jgi:rod shape-determining protein MreD
MNGFFSRSHHRSPARQPLGFKQSRNSTYWTRVGWPILYTLIAFLIQAQWIARLPFPGMRVDLLLPVTFGVALEWPLLPGLLWACVWGYVADTLSGKLLGFHVLSYVVAVCLVNVSAERFELENPLYQMGLVGGCAVGQALVLGLFLFLDPAGSALTLASWQNLIVRSIFTTLVTPFVIFPIVGFRRSNV